MLVFMRLAKKYAVPSGVALLYEFLNSADLRTYMEKGERHTPSDELETPVGLENWMRERGLLRKNESITVADHRRALKLRDALRAFLRLPPDYRRKVSECAERLNKISELYPLAVRVQSAGAPILRPVRAGNGIGQVLAELLSLTQSGNLDRLKTCASNECQWIFFDRSKPGNRRWCSSLICGNRQKTRDYRKRSRVSTWEKDIRN
jgi:predicted RNA-binding Zn ribbon-like protein